MKMARWVFLIAGIYGLLVLAPGFFLEKLVSPPALTHPEFYYGFYGSALVWQAVFLLIGRDPARWRALMPLAVLEKAAFFLPALWLWSQGRLAAADGPFIGAMIDGLLLAAFAVAWRLSRPAAA